MPKLSENAYLALRVVTVVWAAIALIHFTIWALICIIGGHLDGPWWLWVAVPPGAVIGTLWLTYGERAS